MSRQSEFSGCSGRSLPTALTVPHAAGTTKALITNFFEPTGTAVPAARDPSGLA